MYIYELCHCESCAKTYKGRFKMHIDGSVTCVDCTQPDVYVGLQIEEVQYAKRNDLLYEQLCDMLIKDLEHLYPLIPAEQDTIMSQMYLSDGKIDLSLVYYQYNPLALVRVMQEVAYLAAHYIIQNQVYTKEGEVSEVVSPLYEFSVDIIKKYFHLRLVALSDESQQVLWSLVSREEIQELKLVINYVKMA